jgi:hypothetical protein
VHYGTLDVEDLGRVYEALLELEPGVTSEPMCRLRRAKLEVVVPLAQGAAYRAHSATAADDDDDSDESEEEESADEGKGKTKVAFVEEIPAQRFYLRVGLGRKASGSYYTPHAFVRFLVQETLGPQVQERSPHDNPRPLAILALNVLDPAMGSGHFLVEACRFLGDALYEACRLCDERALDAQAKADSAKTPEERAELLARAQDLWQRVSELPDPNDELEAYLPSRVLDAEEGGVSQRKALALCRRLVAVHCLYGVDKNPLAVELARVSLWLESYAEGLPLTFLDHRLVCGDSITGPFFEHLLTYPGTGKPIEELHTQGIARRLTQVLAGALAHVRQLEASVGKDIAELEQKRLAKQQLDVALAPLRLLAAAWSGGVMLGNEADDIGYELLLQSVAAAQDGAAVLANRSALARMEALGREMVPYDLLFPEVFHPSGGVARTGGFDAVLGNPPWDAVRRADDQFFSRYDLRAFAGNTKKEKSSVQRKLLGRADVAHAYAEYVATFESQDRASDRLFSVHRATISSGLAGRGTYDAYMLFCERGYSVLTEGGVLGMVLPSAFHANEGATGVRRLYLDSMNLICCFSFENRKQLFEIHRSYKFAAAVARRTDAGTQQFTCAFYLDDIEWLSTKSGALEYTRTFVETTGGEYLSFLELRSEADVKVASTCFASKLSFGKWVEA